MKVTSIGNAVRVSDIDLMDDRACAELGRLVAHECVVFIDDSVAEDRLQAIHAGWGQRYQALVYRYIANGRLKGRHWRRFMLDLGRTSRAVHGIAPKGGMTRVSFEKDKRGRPIGFFANGELGWHCERPTPRDSQLVSSLMSLWDTEGSQTAFLCTAPAYDSLNHEDRSVVDELVSVWSWDGGLMAGDLSPEQLEIGRFSSMPLPDMRTPLIETTATGRRGFRFPNHSFRRFEGMNETESVRYRDHLWSLINRPSHVYTHDWTDGQTVFMDQNITLHARPPTSINQETRTLSRCVSYVDRLFPDHAPLDYVEHNGQRLDHDEFIDLIDAFKLETFEAANAEAVGQTVGI